MAVANPEIKQTQLFINNEWCDSVSGKTFPSINPANGKVICHLQEGDKADIDKAVIAAKKAYTKGSKWRKTPAAGRGVLMTKLAELFTRDMEYLANLVALDNGKPYADAVGEVHGSIAVINYYAGWCDKNTGETMSDLRDGFFVYTRHEPVGVVGQIIPWNFPLMMISWKLGPALSCGCTVVMKPAEQTPLVGLHVASLIKEAGFPPGVVNIVNGYGPTAGAAISNHMDINKLAFTGSVEVGRIVMQAAAQSNLKRVSLELGGKSPLIVFPDVDVDFAAGVAHGALFYNSGQVCSAGSRTFVHEDIYDAFVAKSVQIATSKKLGSHHTPDVNLGPIVNEEQYNKVLKYIETGKKEGASLKVGGSQAGDEGYYIQPTVFANVTDDMTIAKEEIFGPVQSILKFKTMDEVITRANNTTFGLGAAVLTNDLNKAMEVVDNIQAGSVWVNCYNAFMPQVPFGGFKQSGIGRELGKYALEEYTEVKTVTMKLTTSA